MKKYWLFLPPLAMLIWLILSGSTESTGAKIVLLYGAAALTALTLLAGYVCFARNRDGLFVLLFFAVALVNSGYYGLALSQTLSQALWANRFSYLGSVFLPAVMLLIIMKNAGVSIPKRLPWLFAAAGAMMFALAASPGILPIYYKEVALVTADGLSYLQKVYGPLHIVYGFYLLAYFIAMVAVIVHATMRRKAESIGHVMILAIAALVNIVVWLIEQIDQMSFEFLSFSYIISGLFLLGLHLSISEHQQLQTRVQQAELQRDTALSTPSSAVSENPPISDRFTNYLSGVERLTPTEKAIYDCYIRRMTTKEIMAAMNITENTLKFHNKHLYHKLGVSSRKELQAIHSELNAGEECAEPSSIS